MLWCYGLNQKMNKLVWVTSEPLVKSYLDSEGQQRPPQVRVVMAGMVVKSLKGPLFFGEQESCIHSPLSPFSNSDPLNLGESS